MKWISERDALIAQTMAFVQSVTGKKDDFHPPERPTAAPDVPVETSPSRPYRRDRGGRGIRGRDQAAASPARPARHDPAARTSGDFRSEMQARIANFRKHQERFEREREEYCAATLTKLRAAIRDPSLRPPAEN